MAISPPTRYRRKNKSKRQAGSATASNSNSYCTDDEQNICTNNQETQKWAHVVDNYGFAQSAPLIPLLPMEFFFGMESQDARRFWMMIEEILTAFYPDGPAPWLVYTCIETRLRGPAAVWWDNCDRTRRHRGDRHLSATNLQKIKNDFLAAFGGNMDYRNCMKHLRMVKQFEDESLARYRERILHLLWNHGVPERGGSEFARTLREESVKVFVNGLKSGFIVSALEDMKFPTVDAAYGAVHFIEHMFERERKRGNPLDDFNEPVKPAMVQTPSQAPMPMMPPVEAMGMEGMPHIPMYYPPFPMPFVTGYLPLSQ